jgi:NAD-dependent DNA ligase
MSQLEDLGFTTARSLLPQSVLDAEDPMAAIAALGAERKGLNFLMDGAVLKVNTAAERTELGEGSRAPKWAVAYKYPAVEEPTVIEDIEYNIGKTGRLTIRARCTPVEVDGSVVQYASLHNVGDLLRKDIRIGDTVSAYKANDIIPRFTCRERTCAPRTPSRGGRPRPAHSALNRSTKPPSCGAASTPNAPSAAASSTPPPATPGWTSKASAAPSGTR